jgi:uncharacterized protein (TIGR02001 family)
VRLFASGIVALAGLAVGTARCAEGDLFGGSVGVTSDYLVRGISRSDDHGALQLDLHYLDASGFVAGIFASNAQLNSHLSSSAELDAFIGFAWGSGRDWQGRALLGHYAYPWSNTRSSYDYDELDLDLSYREWLNAHFTYSPDAPLISTYHGLIGVTAESAEVNLQHRVFGKLSAMAGVGYAFYKGQEPSGYGYWSVGAAYELAPVSLVLSYVNTTTAAKALFYNAAADNRWSGTIIWRF